MNYQILKTEIALPTYSGMTDQEIADSLNAATVSTFKKVDYADVASYLMLVEKYLPIKKSSEGLTPKDSAESFMLAMRTFQSFDLKKPGVETAVVNLLDALIVDALLTTSDKAAILSLADDTISRARELDLPVIKTGHIETARGI